MTKKDLTICGIPYEEYQVMKHNQLAKALNDSDSDPDGYKAYCKQLEKDKEEDLIKQLNADLDTLLNNMNLPEGI